MGGIGARTAIASGILVAMTAAALTSCSLPAPASEDELAAVVEDLPGVTGWWVSDLNSLPFGRNYGVTVTVSSTITESEIVGVFDALGALPGFNDYSIDDFSADGDSSVMQEYHGPRPTESQAHDIADIWIAAREITGPHSFVIDSRYENHSGAFASVSLERRLSDEEPDPAKTLDETVGFLRALDGLESAVDVHVSLPGISVTASPFEAKLLDPYDAINPVAPVTEMDIQSPGGSTWAYLTILEGSDVDAAREQAAGIAEETGIEIEILESGQDVSGFTDPEAAKVGLAVTDAMAAAGLEGAYVEGDKVHAPGSDPETVAAAHAALVDLPEYDQIQTEYYVETDLGPFALVRRPGDPLYLDEMLAMQALPGVTRISSKAVSFTGDPAITFEVYFEPDEPGKLGASLRSTGIDVAEGAMVDVGSYFEDRGVRMNVYATIQPDGSLVSVEEADELAQQFIDGWNAAI